MARTKKNTTEKTFDGCMASLAPEAMTVRLTFITECLATGVGDKELYKEYIASKSPNAATIEDEVAAIGVEGALANAMQVFPKTEDGTPFIYDYQIKGFFKEKCSFLRKKPGTLSSKIKAFKKEIDGLIFVKERTNIIKLSGPLGKCERSLRAQTPSGEFTALACSETIPAGSTCIFTIYAMGPDYLDRVREWLSYGFFHGTGQWRNAGYGRFVWEELDSAGKVVGGNYDLKCCVES